ncbi:GTP pyrophosphokinase [Oceanirhabdus seepicola]|uniref:(P)ppGpp synthetase n=1 Tax=Oceanirhabdus seepicola TaxID=2828781 RepID=A0A9J6NZN0_9CLOT|nr:(p)ppGpp synthetase [Oceanirhabdus seepicola]MCM1988608.1 (p)ppGpp synthetase [Oceanirhabdus seepicola]
MELKVFNFIDEVNNLLEDKRSILEEISIELSAYFQEILILNNEGYMNVNSRVKGNESLKEKILRNNYYKKYNSPQRVIENLSDLMGVRIECRFIEDEKRVYKILKKHFSKRDMDGYSYNELNNRIRLDLEGKQPQEQKNGFKIFRIDGVYIENGNKCNFELQIKSLVNTFWGEIEHKVIYKNNNYVMWDGFLKDIMASIKKNLTMIDNQLQIVYNQFNETNSGEPEVRKVQMELLLSKMIYEIYSNKMKTSIGIVVDFRKSCDTIMKYIFRSNNADNLSEYNHILLKTFTRLNEIGRNKVQFNSELEFEREVCFEGEFCEIIGNKMLQMLNEEFEWNLFFRVLFEIELGNNAEDFETFIAFIKERFEENNFDDLYINLDVKHGDAIKKDIMYVIAKLFVEVDSINFIYDNVIEKINKATRKLSRRIGIGIKNIDQWESVKGVFLKLFEYKLLALFDKNVKVSEVKDLINIGEKGNDEVHISSAVIDYIYKLDDMDEIKAETAIKFFKI